MSNKVVFSMRASVLAVQGALLCMAVLPVAYAADSVAELTTPVNSIEVSETITNKSSYKFGEYNELQKKGDHLNGSVELYGGDPASAQRFKVIGGNQGLAGEYAEQGLFRFTFGYDELLKNRSDSYMTPYLGSGTDTLTLPANWETNRKACAVTSTSSGNTNFGGASNATAGTSGCGNYYVNQNATAGNKSAAPVGNAGALTADELADFKIVPLQTKRSATSLGLALNLGPQWTLSAGVKQEEKNGAQVIGQPIGGAAANAVMVANPIKYVTNQVDFKLAFAGEKAFGEIGYYGSTFNDQIKSLTYQNPWFSSATPSVSATGVSTYPYPDAGRMATAPSNQFHQVLATVGYAFSNSTRLVANAAYSRNSQNEAYLPAGTVSAASGTAPASWIVPRGSLDGEVATTSYGVKFTSRPLKSVNLLASYRSEERENNSSVASYTTPFNPQDGQLAVSTFPYNLAYSRRLKVGNLEADWAFSKGQALKVGAESQDIKRWCNSLTASIAPCVNSVDSSENSTRLEYRNSMLESVTGRVSFVTSNRDASKYLANVSYYAGDLLTRFNMTDRHRDKLRSSVNWQASEVLDFTASFESTKDTYALGRNPSGFLEMGLKNYDAKVWNLDATVKVTDNISVNAFFSNEDMSSMLLGNGASSTAASITALATVPGGAFWSADLKDKVRTFGLNLRASDLMGGKLDLVGSYLSSRGTSPYALTVGSYLAYSSGALPTLPAQTLNNTLVKGAVTGFPDTYANSDSVSLSAKYNLSKNSAVRVSFLHQKLSSSDPAYYNGLQAGAANAQTAPALSATGASLTTKINGTLLPATSVYPYSTILPSNELAPNYSVNAVGVAYIYSF